MPKSVKSKQNKIILKDMKTTKMTLLFISMTVCILAQSQINDRQKEERFSRKPVRGFYATDDQKQVDRETMRKKTTEFSRSNALARYNTIPVVKLDSIIMSYLGVNDSKSEYTYDSKENRIL